MGSGFTGDWDGRRPPVHQPPDPPYTLDQLQASARILSAQLGFGWEVKATQRPEGPRLEVKKSLSQDEPIIAATLKEARKRVAEYMRENR